MIASTPAPAPSSEPCFICCEVIDPAAGLPPAQLPCSHGPICFRCAVRWRGLYGHSDCPFCKQNCATITFKSTNSSSSSISCQRINATFQSEKDLLKAQQLLQYKCPVCPEIYFDQPALLRRHMQRQHKQHWLCVVCLETRKLLADEHVAYTSTAALRAHMIDEHPFCQFCRKHFSDSNALYTHLEQTHEHCFLCRRQGIHNQYYSTYDDLQAHFRSSHILCERSECLSQRFIVFSSSLDYESHMISQHKSTKRTLHLHNLRNASTNFNGSLQSETPQQQQQQVHFESNDDDLAVPPSSSSSSVVIGGAALPRYAAAVKNTSASLLTSVDFPDLPLGTSSSSVGLDRSNSSWSERAKTSNSQGKRVMKTSNSQGKRVMKKQVLFQIGFQ